MEKSQLPQRRADGLYVDTWLPEETREIRKEIRAFAEKELAPIANRINTTPESRDSFPWDMMKKLGEAGIYRIPFSKEHGGRGLQYPTLASQIVEEELAYFSNSVASALYDAPVALLGTTLVRAGSPDIIARYLPRLLAGEITASFATSEPQASTDLSVESMVTEAQRVEGGYRVNGIKCWITNACVANFLIFLCKVDNKLTMLLTDMDAEGIFVSDPDKKMGNLGQLTSEIKLKDVFVPEENLLGAEGHGLRVALSSLSEARILVGSMALGMSQAAFDHAVNYMERRKVFGKALASMQHWQYVFARHAIAIENARNICYKAAYIVDTTGDTSSPTAAMAKVTATVLSREIASDAMQVFGARGFVREMAATGETGPIEAIYRDCKIGEIYEGANEVLLMIIARSIFGRDFVGM